MLHQLLSILSRPETSRPILGFTWCLGLSGLVGKEEESVDIYPALMLSPLPHVLALHFCRRLFEKSWRAMFKQGGI